MTTEKAGHRLMEVASFLKAIHRNDFWWLKKNESVHVWVDSSLDSEDTVRICGEVVSGFGRESEYRRAAHDIRGHRFEPRGALVDQLGRAYDALMAKLAPPLPTEDMEIASMALNSEEGLQVFADHLLAQGRIAAYPTAWFLVEDMRSKLARGSILEAAGRTARNILGPHIFAEWTTRWDVVERTPRKATHDPSRHCDCGAIYGGPNAHPTMCPSCVVEQTPEWQAWAKAAEVSPRLRR